MSSFDLLPPIRSLVLLLTHSTGGKDVRFVIYRRFAQSHSKFYYKGHPFPNVSYVLSPRWMHKMNPTDLANIPCGVSGYTAAILKRNCLYIQVWSVKFSWVLFSGQSLSRELTGTRAALWLYFDLNGTQPPVLTRPLKPKWLLWKDLLVWLQQGTSSGFWDGVHCLHICVCPRRGVCFWSWLNPWPSSNIRDNTSLYLP